MINAVMIDDDVAFLGRFAEVMQKIAEEQGFVLSLDTVTEPQQILEAGKKYDIYFFDIVMPGTSGIELADELREQHNNRPFVFVSGYEEHIRESIAVRPCGFVRKPYLEEDLREVISRLKELFHREEAEVILKDNRRDRPIRPSQIICIKSSGHYLRLIYAGGGSELIRDRMKAVEEKLRGFDFLRVNNQCVINLTYLQDVQKDKVLLKNGIREKITGTYLTEASGVLENWLAGHEM